jgi:hypothetical protein
MITNVPDVDLGSYAMSLGNLSISQDMVGSQTINMSFSLPYANKDNDTKLDQFFTDLRIMNTLRSNPTAVVRDHYEQLLSLLALTSNTLPTAK